MKHYYTLYKIKPGKRQKWLDWCNELMTTHKEEASLSLVEEDLVQEMCLLFGEGDETFVVYKHKPLPGKLKKPFNPDRELNQKHIALYTECLEMIRPRVMGYDIHSPGQI